MPTPLRPEVLAPASNPDMLRAAVENGADAVYFGLEDFNARMRAENFKSTDLPAIVADLHERGVRAYITLNTLIFPAELSRALDLLRLCEYAAVDAVLFQDLGLAHLAARCAPHLPIHASTQMTLTTAESVEAVLALGLRLDRIVAARELTLRELTRLARHSPAPVEAFVHGALCVAYSGQCLTSESLGGRSANRGQCAQACRLPYDLVIDGETSRDHDNWPFVLSPMDLAALDHIPDLARSGVVSLKIEGRYKSPEYVAATVQAYRRAVDQLAGPVAPADDGHIRERLAMTFSRGFTAAYLPGANHQAVVEGRTSSKQGLLVGTVTAATARGIEAELTAPLKPGDGVLFGIGVPEAQRQGGRVYALYDGRVRLDAHRPAPGAPAAHLRLVFARDSLNPRAIPPGTPIVKTSDPLLDRELTATFDGTGIRHRRPVHAQLTARAGEPLRVTLSIPAGPSVTVTDDVPLAPAANRPSTPETLRVQLDRFGSTPFRLGDAVITVEGAPLVPHSRLNQLRRRAAEELVAQIRAVPPHRHWNDAPAVETFRELDRLLQSAPPPAPESRLALLCRTLEQVEALAAQPGVAALYADFEDLRRYRDARRLIPAGGPAFVPATIRVLKPGEAPFARMLLDADPDALLIRNLASAQIVRPLAPSLPLHADYALNIANPVTALLLHRAGYTCLTPSYDLSIDQLADLVQGAPPGWFEVTLHQHMPMFHMEHCVFCRFLSTGTNFTNCGRPCEHHTLHLRDRVGQLHPVIADTGCRNTVFNGQAQTAAAYLPRLQSLGIRRFRVELLNQSPDEALETLRLYREALAGRLTPRDLQQQLRAASHLGVTPGTLAHA